MKVKELIKELQQIENQELDISIIAENGLFLSPHIKAIRNNPLSEIKEYVIHWS